MPKDEGSDSRDDRFYYTLANVGLEMVAPMLLGLAIDLYIGWTPLLTVIGLVAGFVGGIAHLVALSNKHDRLMQDRKRPEDKRP
jgi:F0F1-type ATP synthase assembly protein I